MIAAVAQPDKRGEVIDDLRARLRDAGSAAPADIAPQALDAELAARTERSVASTMRRIVNLTGTVIHTNLGRSLLPEQAVARVASLMSAPTNLEYDLVSGSRGDRDSIVEALLCQLTADATVILLTTESDEELKRQARGASAGRRGGREAGRKGWNWRCRRFQ